MVSLQRELEPEPSSPLLAGKRYREHLISALREKGLTVEVPMNGPGNGKQLQWLGENTP